MSPARTSRATRAPRTASPAPTGAQSQPTPEMQKIAQALQQNDAQTLSQQLRQLAQKAQSGQMTPSQQQQAAPGLAETFQRPARDGDAADPAARPGRRPGDGARRQSGRRSGDAKGRRRRRARVAAAERPAGDAGRPELPAGRPGRDGRRAGPRRHPRRQWQGRSGTARPGSGQRRSRAGPGQQGPPEYGGEGNGGGGGGRGKPNTTYHKGQKPNHKVHQSPGYGADAPHWLNPNFDPSKNPRYAKLYFGKPKTAGPSQAGPTRKSRPGENDGPVTSTVPYYNSVVTARQDRRKRDGPGGHPARLQEKRLGLLQLPPAPNPAAPGGDRGRGREAVRTTASLPLFSQGTLCQSKSTNKPSRSLRTDFNRVRAEVGKVIVGQHGHRGRGADLPAVRRTRAAGRRPRPRQDPAGADALPGAGSVLRPRPVHAGSDARRHHRHQHPDGRRHGAQGLSIPARPHLRQHRAGRRSQPRHA